MRFSDLWMVDSKANEMNIYSSESLVSWMTVLFSLLNGNPFIALALLPWIDPFLCRCDVLSAFALRKRKKKLIQNRIMNTTTYTFERTVKKLLDIHKSGERTWDRNPINQMKATDHLYKSCILDADRQHANPRKLEWWRQLIQTYAGLAA